METFKNCVLIAFWVLVFALLVLISFPITGIVVSASWNWFLAPLAGLRAISITEGIGLSLFLTVIGTIITLPLKTWKNAEPNPNDSLNMIAAKGVGKMVGLLVFFPLAWLAGAWVWHTFIISPPGY
jgi:hypothetical protein